MRSTQTRPSRGRSSGEGGAGGGESTRRNEAANRRASPAARLGLRIDTVKVDVEADLDVRGFLGADDSTRPGPGAIRVKATIEGPESESDYRRLAEAVENHCPVLDLFTNTTPVHGSVVINGVA